jgi:hypothetical protein
MKRNFGGWKEEVECFSKKQKKQLGCRLHKNAFLFEQRTGFAAWLVTIIN